MREKWDGKMDVTKGITWQDGSSDGDDVFHYNYIIENDMRCSQRDKGIVRLSKVDDHVSSSLQASPTLRSGSIC